MDELEFHFNSSNFPEKKLIRRKNLITSFDLKPGANILDVGAFGVCSEDEIGFNTSEILLDHYTHCNIDGINLNNSYLKNPRHKEMNMIEDNFFTHNYNKKYDLIICDLYFQPIRKFWANNYIENLVTKIMNTGGHFLIWFHRNLRILEGHQYLEYNADDYAEFIINFWQVSEPTISVTKMQEMLPLRLSDKWQVISCHEEAERDYINWAILKLIN